MEDCLKTLPGSDIAAVMDEVWKKVALALDERDPSAKIGPKQINQRNNLNGIIHQLRTGCQ